MIGEHDGAIFYTLGQRHGLDVGGGLPYYVADKDMEKNIVYVTTDLDDERLWKEQVRLRRTHWINESPQQGQTLQARARHRGKLIDAEVSELKDGRATISLAKPIKALSPGQSVVLYEDERVVGGGIVT